jgi:hypothetical protein
MGFKKTLALTLSLLVFWLAGISILRNNLGSDIRFFNDDFDRSVYAKDGEWFPRGLVPYKDTISEYPQVATYLFALPYLLERFQPGENFYWLYSTVFSFITLGFLFATTSLLYQMLPSHKNRAFLMLLPAGIYFTFNRYDILPSFLVLLSLFFLSKKKALLAGVFLGIATLTKWYPVLLLPVFLSYSFRKQRRIDWKLILAFGLTCLVIIAPTFLAGGLKALLVPYLVHAGRGFEQVSLPALLQRTFPVWAAKPLNLLILTYGFLFLSVAAAPLSLIAPIDTFEKVVQWSLVVVTLFIVFSRIWSPQWILWVLPLLVLVARDRTDLIWIVSYGILNYLAFPVIFDRSGPTSWQLGVAGLAGFAVLVRFAAVGQLRRNEGTPKGLS